MAQSISRVEPPHWYVDMNNSEVQLLIYGENISDLKLSIKGKGIEIKKVHQVKNPNYLFIDLSISKHARAKEYSLNFKSDNGKTISWKYDLKERNVDIGTHKTFSSDDVIYLIMPDRFANGDPSNDVHPDTKEGLNRDVEYGRHGGDLQGIHDKLDYIQYMGFTALWLNPVLENDMPDWSYHGYATTDYYQVDPRLGTNELYQKLCKDARAKGIGMIKDMIANHCGSEHWWMDDLPTYDWINYQDEDYQQTNHRKTTVVDPYAATEDKDVMVKGWFVPSMPDLNQDNPFLAKYIIQNSIWWIEFLGLYGIRQDTYSYPEKDFMRDWTCAIQNEYPGFNIVGEEWVDNAGIISYWQKGKKNQDGYTSCLKSVMDFPMNFLVHKAFTEEEVWGKGLVRLYEHLADDHHYPDPMNLVTMLDNHDMSRVYRMQNRDAELVKMSLAYLLTIRGIPQIYSGTEILMDHPESDSHGMIRKDFPGGWLGDSVNGFTGTGLSEEAKDAQAYLKKLLNWRKNCPSVQRGKLMHYEPQNGTYVYFRYNDSESYMIILNKNKESISLDLTRFSRFLEGQTSLYNIITEKSSAIESELKLAKRGAYIYKIQS